MGLIVALTSLKVDTGYFRWQFSNSFFLRYKREIGAEGSSQDDYGLKFEQFYNT